MMSSNSKRSLRSPPPLPPPLFHHVRLVQLFRWKRTSPTKFGFSIVTKKHVLGTERIHIIDSIEPSTPSYYSGLRQGDHLIQVNGVSVIHRSQKKVGQMIRDSENEVTLLVCDEPSFQYLKRINVPIDSNSKDYPVVYISGSTEIPLDPLVIRRYSKSLSRDCSPILIRKIMKQSKEYTVN